MYRPACTVPTKATPPCFTEAEVMAVMPEDEANRAMDRREGN